MDVEDLGKTVVATGTVGGGILWLLREKVATWSRGLTDDRFKAMEGKIVILEQAQQEHAVEVDRLSNAMEHSSRNVADAIGRLSVALERIVETTVAQGEGIARIEGRLEQMRDGR